jgi:hypothetical protein
MVRSYTNRRTQRVQDTRHISPRTPAVPGTQLPQANCHTHIHKHTSAYRTNPLRDRNLQHGLSACSTDCHHNMLGELSQYKAHHQQPRCDSHFCKKLSLKSACHYSRCVVASLHISKHYTQQLSAVTSRTSRNSLHEPNLNRHCRPWLMRSNKAGSTAFPHQKKQSCMPVSSP